jgi:hypothetical protein
MTDQREAAAKVCEEMAAEIEEKGGNVLAAFVLRDAAKRIHALPAGREPVAYLHGMREVPGVGVEIIGALSDYGMKLDLPEQTPLYASPPPQDSGEPVAIPKGHCSLFVHHSSKCAQEGRCLGASPPPPQDAARDAENDKLVAFFNTPEGFSQFGNNGDYQNWTPAETAIAAMRDLITTRKRLRWMYDREMDKLPSVTPRMTFDEYCAAIDRAMLAEKGTK